jgi:K+-sensing histidine kinase KdpD
MAAVLLGAALVPLRGVTTASNFTFAFLVLTIVVAEFGGRWAAVTTALTSALSLDFFLTQPYLRLTITEKHDIIAFTGLAACGLIAAALGSRRRERIADLRAARARGDLIHSVLGELGRVGPLESRLATILDASRTAFPLAAIGVRDIAGRVLAASPRGHGLTPVPALVVEPETLLEREQQGQRRPGDLPLPAQGARLPLAVGNRQWGWLDMWGTASPASGESRRALTAVARAVAALLAADEPGALPADPNGPRE